MKKILSALILVAVFASCTTQRKVVNFMNNNDKFRIKYLAENCEVDTLTEYIKGKDSIIIKEIEVKGDSVLCPEIVTQEGVVIPAVKVKCPDQKVSYKEVLRIDTVVKVIENTSKLKGLDQKIKEQDKTISILKWAIGVLLGLFVLAMFLKRFF